MWGNRVSILARRFCSSTTTATATTPERQRLLDKWATYWKNLWIDYTTVAKDVATDARNRPVKAALITTSAVVAGYCAVHNPDETSFIDQLLNCSAELGTVSPLLQNRQSAEHITFLRNERNEQRLKRLNLLLFSVMYIDDNSKNCCTYYTECNYLRSSLFQFTDRVVDIGFLDRWWILAKNMENYDVNY